MDLIDSHIHMYARTTDDYERMALSGVVAVSEPAFWAGHDRSPAAFRDYFHALTEWEPTRAARYGIDHHCWVCINSKEAEDLGKSREVMALLPGFLPHARVLGVGEIGLNKNTPNEITVFQEQVEIALQHDTLILVHTPHLEDKLKGTRILVDLLRGDSRIQPHRVVIDHCEEHTVRLALDAGFWAGLTLYPTTKVTPQRAADIIEVHGPERILVNSSADWGPSDPLSVHRTALELRRRGHPGSLIRRVVHDNPDQFLGQSPSWRAGRGR